MLRNAVSSAMRFSSVGVFTPANKIVEFWKISSHIAKRQEKSKFVELIRSATAHISDIGSSMTKLYDIGIWFQQN